MAVQNIANLTIYVFLFIVGLSFLKYCIFKNEIDNRGFQKIIGGLSVFVIAIIASNVLVYIISLFIGGLIIASEDFMKFLTAVIKSRDDKISETIDSLNHTKATEKEIDKKNEEDISYIKAIPNIEDIKLSANDEVNMRLKKVREVENLVNSYLKKEYGNKYDDQIKLKNKNNQLIVDGVIFNNNEIESIVEIKYISSGKFDHFKHIIKKLKLKVKKLLGSEIPLLFVIVSEKITENDILNIKDDCACDDIEFLFFRLSDNMLTKI